MSEISGAQGQYSLKDFKVKFLGQGRLGILI